MRNVAQQLTEPHADRPSVVIAPEKLLSAQDVLDALARREGQEPHLLAMLRSTLVQVCGYLGKPPHEIAIGELGDIEPGFKAHLKARRYKRNSVRSYVNYIRILLKAAQELGWRQERPDIQEAWAPILSAVKKRLGCRGIVKYAVRQGIKPADFSEADLADWGERLLNQGRSYSYVHMMKRAFRRIIREQGFNVDVPKISLPVRKVEIVYGVPVQELPNPLRNEVINLIRWKTERFSPGRPHKSRHRPVTARLLQGFICRLFGFVQRLQDRTVTSLRELITREALEGYVAWYLNDRKLKSCSLTVAIGTLYAAVRTYPPLAKSDFNWMPRLVSELPEDSAIGRNEAKEGKWVEYDVLAAIPEKLRKERSTNLKASPKQIAITVRNELLMTWLITLPWRQRNLRECKLRPKDEGGNLFKEPIPPNTTMDKPGWVKEKLKVDPQEPIWQFYFRSEETKTGYPVRAIVPRQLLSLLEEYIAVHRPQLTMSGDPGTLLVTPSGRPLSTGRLKDIVADIACRYTGRRVTPHLFRDIFAVNWLNEHPEDYLVVSKILWHQDVKTTLRIYGRNFDESHAIRRVEEWLDRRLEKREERGENH